MSQAPKYTIFTLARANYDENTVEVLGVYPAYVDAVDAVWEHVRKVGDSPNDFPPLSKTSDGVNGTTDEYGLVEYQIRELDVPEITVSLIQGL